LKQETNPRISPHPPRPNSSLRDGLHLRPSCPFLPRRFAARLSQNAKSFSAVSYYTSLEPILAGTANLRALRARGDFFLNLTIRAGGMNPVPPRGVPRVAALCPCRAVSILIFLAGEFKKGMGGRRPGRLRLLNEFSTELSKLWILTSSIDHLPYEEVNPYQGVCRLCR